MYTSINTVRNQYRQQYKEFYEGGPSPLETEQTVFVFYLFDSVRPPAIHLYALVNVFFRLLTLPIKGIGRLDYTWDDILMTTSVLFTL